MFIVHETIRVFFAVVSLVLVALLTNPIQDSLSADPTGSDNPKYQQTQTQKEGKKILAQESNEVKMNKLGNKVDRKFKKLKSRS